MENNTIPKQGLGLAFRGIESHIEEVKERKAKIAELENENLHDQESAVKIAELLDKLKESLAA